MRKFCYLLLFLLVGCYSPDEFPLIPSISFESLSFSELDNGTDTLKLAFDFEDGDGDLGLLGDETDPPYHEANYIVDSDNKLVTFNDEFSPPFILVEPEGDLFFINTGTGQTVGPFTSIPTNPVQRPFSDVDNRPSNFTCINYRVDSILIDDLRKVDSRHNIADTLNIIIPGGEQRNYYVVADTFYIQENANFNNIQVTFEVKSGDIFEELDFRTLFGTDGCGPSFDGRFPIFDDDNVGSALSGTIRYNMLSRGFVSALREDTFRIRVQIRDRALNNSNEIVSDAVTLSQIRN
ncbi:MAG TPA: hypothetical protein ACFCUD_04395 [Cyclobacteriaceae bacterium]